MSSYIKSLEWNSSWHVLLLSLLILFYMVIIIQTCVGHMVFWAVNELKEWQCPKWIATVNKWLNHVEYKIIVAVQSLSHVQLFCDPMDCSPPGSFVRGISQARILESVAISFSRGSSHLGSESGSPGLAGRFFTTEPPGKSHL